MTMDCRIALYLLYETFMWTPDVLRLSTGSTCKLLLHVFAHNMLGLQRPKATLFRGAVLSGPVLWYAMYQARAEGNGVEQLIYTARVEKGWFLFGVVAVHVLIQLVLVLAVSVVTDLSCRRGFIRHHRQQQQAPQQPQ